MLFYRFALSEQPNKLSGDKLKGQHTEYHKHAGYYQ